MSWTSLRRTALAAALTLTLTLTLTAALGGKAVAQASPPAKVFVGYLYGPPRNLHYGLYTHLCHAFLTADGDGRVNTTRGVPSPALTAEAHAAGVKVLLSLGGWGWDRQFAAIVSKPESEDRYIKAVLAIVADNDYDGIDLDWEYPDTKDEVTGFERLTRRFRAGLDALGKTKGRPMFQTMAVAANPGTLRWYRKDHLVETLDWLNVMTYDMAGDWTGHAGHHSPLFGSSKLPAGSRPSTQRAIDYLLDDRKVPADRVALGIPLYGRGFGVSEPYAPTKGAPKPKLAEGDYRALVRLQREQHWTRTWDDETKNPWLTSPDRKVVVGYDDPESAAIKARWAASKGLRGVFFWQVAGDRLPDGSNPVQEAAHKALSDAAAKPAH